MKRIALRLAVLAVILAAAAPGCRKDIHEANAHPAAPPVAAVSV